jgi:hypothetical protein
LPTGKSYKWSKLATTNLVMTKTRLFPLLAVAGLLIFTSACKKTETETPPPPPPPDPCLGVTVSPQTTKVDAITGQTNGSITVTSPVGTDHSYSINGGTFQASANFNNLGAGTYTIAAKTDKGCTGNTSVTLAGYGPKYYAVKQLIMGYCGPCHLNGGTSGGRNYDTDAGITGAWDRIKARAVDGVPSFMPQGGQLTNIDKQKIVDWVNAGHLTTN